MLPAWALWLAFGFMTIGLAGAVLPGIPGVGLIWLTVLVYALAEGFTSIGPIAFGVITLLAIAGVTADIWMTQAGSRLGGASWQAMLAGFALGTVGMLAGLFIGGIGAIPGALIGSLAGILLVEYRRRRDWRQVARAGAGWAAGCVLSAVVELTIGLAMVALFAWQTLGTGLG